MASPEPGRAAADPAAVSVEPAPSPTPTPTPTSEADEAARIWLPVIEAIEADAARARAGAALRAWNPPAGMPELPQQLRPRVRAVLATQQAILAQAGRTRAELGRRLSTLRAAHPQAPQRMPVYLDTLG